MTTRKNQIGNDEISINIDCCPECSATHLIHDESRGEISCSKCGRVVSRNLIDLGAEWRSFNDGKNNKKIRVGSATRLSSSDKGLSTIISKQNKDAHGNNLSPEMRSTFFRIRKWDSRFKIQPSIGRNLREAMIFLDIATSLLKVSKDIKNSTAHIYRKCIKKNLTQGRSINNMVIASLYIACKLDKKPIILDDLETLLSLDKNLIGKCVRLIQCRLNIKLEPNSPRDFIYTIGSRLDINEDVQTLALKILALKDVLELTNGRNPVGIASATLYYAGLLIGERRTQSVISKSAGITENTLRKRFKELRKIKKIQKLLV